MFGTLSKASWPSKSKYRENLKKESHRMLQKDPYTTSLKLSFSGIGSFFGDHSTLIDLIV